MRCAQNPPPCLFVFVKLAAWHFVCIRVDGAAATLSTDAANNSLKTIMFAVDFLDFVTSQPTKTSPQAIQNRFKIESGAVLGALGGDLGTIVVPGRTKAQKWQRKTAKI